MDVKDETLFAIPKYVLVCPASAVVTASSFLPSWRSSRSPPKRL